MRWLTMVCSIGLILLAAPVAAQSPTATPDYRQMVPVGTVMIWAGNSTPSGWLVADGSCVSQTTYAQLYSAIGQVFDYTTSCPVGTFALPDLRDRFPRGAGSRTTTGQVGGNETVTLSVGNLPSHNHTLLPDGSTVRMFSATPQAVNNSAFPTGSIRALNNASVTGSTGSQVPFSVLNPLQVFVFIINAGTNTLILPPTATAVPTATPAFTATPQPTWTVMPTNTPVPTFTPSPQVVVYSTVEANGTAQTVAFEYSMTAGDVLVSVLLFFTSALMVLMMVTKARSK